MKDDDSSSSTCWWYNTISQYKRPKATVHPQTMTSRNVLQLPEGGGFAPWRRSVLLGIIGLWLFYFASHSLVTFLDWTPLSQYCDNVGLTYPCKRPDLIAFQLTATIMQCFMGLHGIYGWHIWLPRQGKSLMAAPQSRVFARLTHAERLCAGIAVYQIWDFLASCTIPEHRNPEFLVHHLLTALTAYLSLEFQMVHHYAVYFGGCSEISSMFLVWCDLDQYFPVDVNTNQLWATFILVNQALFVLSFIAYRVIGWPLYSIPLWNDVLSVTPQPAKTYRPGKLWFLYAFLFLDVALGGLQMYWFVAGLLPKIIEVLHQQ